MVPRSSRLSHMMRRVADKDNLPPTHPMRITAGQLEETVRQSVADTGEIDISKITSEFEAARRVWRDYTGSEAEL